MVSQLIPCLSLCLIIFRLEQYVKELAVKGVAKEALLSLIREKGAELRRADGVTNPPGLRHAVAL